MCIARSDFNAGAVGAWVDIRFTFLVKTNHLFRFLFIYYNMYVDFLPPPNKMGIKSLKTLTKPTKSGKKTLSLHLCLY